MILDPPLLQIWRCLLPAPVLFQISLPTFRLNSGFLSSLISLLLVCGCILLVFQTLSLSVLPSILLCPSALFPLHIPFCFLSGFFPLLFFLILVCSVLLYMFVYYLVRLHLRQNFLIHRLYHPFLFLMLFYFLQKFLILLMNLLLFLIYLSFLSRFHIVLITFLFLTLFLLQLLFLFLFFHPTLLFYRLLILIFGSQAETCIPCLHHLCRPSHLNFLLF